MRGAPCRSNVAPFFPCASDAAIRVVAASAEAAAAPVPRCCVRLRFQRHAARAAARCASSCHASLLRHYCMLLQMYADAIIAADD